MAVRHVLRHTTELTQTHATGTDPPRRLRHPRRHRTRPRGAGRGHPGTPAGRDHGHPAPVRRPGDGRDGPRRHRGGEGWPPGRLPLGPRPPSISLLEVVEAVEGDPRRRVCVLRSAPCLWDGPCDVHQVFAAAQDALLAELGRATIAELAAGGDGGPSGVSPGTRHRRPDEVLSIVNESHAPAAGPVRGHRLGPPRGHRPGRVRRYWAIGC